MEVVNIFTFTVYHRLNQGTPSIYQCKIKTNTVYIVKYYKCLQNNSSLKRNGINVLTKETPQKNNNNNNNNNNNK